MLFRLISLIMLTSGIGIYSETVGDFAPLEVGNLWEYAIRSSDMWKAEEDSGLVTIQMIEIKTLDDSKEFILRKHFKGVKVQRDKNSTYDYVRYDTLFELNDSIGVKEPNYGPSSMDCQTIPVYSRHSIDADSLEFGTFLIDTNGTWELREVFFGDAKIHSIYHADTGFVSSIYSNGDWRSDRFKTIELKSFTRAAPIAVISKLRRHSAPHQSGMHTAKPVALLQLPHLSIINEKGNVLNLLGRVEKPDNRILHRQLSTTLKRY